MREEEDGSGEAQEVQAGCEVSRCAALVIGALSSLALSWLLGLVAIQASISYGFVGQLEISAAFGPGGRPLHLGDPMLLLAAAFCLNLAGQLLKVALSAWHEAWFARRLAERSSEPGPEVVIWVDLTVSEEGTPR